MKRIRASWMLVLAMTALTACDEGGDKSADAPEGDRGAADKPSDGPTKPAKKEATTKLTDKQLDAAYTELNSIDHMSDTWDQKKQRLIAALGEPQKTEGEFLIWWGVKAADGPQPATCMEMKVSEKAGSELGGTDEAKCGL